jgi:hypothetical protein
MVESILSTGSPLPAGGFQWAYDNLQVTVVDHRRHRHHGLFRAGQSDVAGVLGEINRQRSAWLLVLR